MSRIRYISTIALMLTFAIVQGQDQQYTQFYASPLTLNPAFAGTSMQSRAAMNYRNQWAGLPKAFVAYSASFDHFVSEINSGFGLVINHDRAGTGALSYTSAAFQYAYEIKLSRKLSLRPAISFGFGSTYLDVDRLTFGDQLARGDGADNTLDPDRNRFAQEPVAAADFGSGIVLFSEKFWFGAAMHHINEPVQSVIGNDTRLPRRFTAHGGFRFKLADGGAFSTRQYLIPAFHYQSQGMFDQLDLGFYYEYNPITFGLWYRGLPGIKSNELSYINHDAAAVLVGYEINNYRFGYSYDVTISKLSSRSGGSHEVSLVIEWANKKSKRKNKRRVMPCAKF
jgi:type IX secretion system PorP/SprF family membrane protein